MRIITNDGFMDREFETTDDEILEYLSLHRNQSIHVIMTSVNGNTYNEMFIHNNFSKLKEFQKCDITFEYLTPEFMAFPRNLIEYDEYNKNRDKQNGNKVFTIEKILEDEEFVRQIADEINSAGFSPLEKSLETYSIASSLKEFKEEKRGPYSEQSRNLYEYLNNSYMVCAGYVNFLETLCYFVGIPSIHESVYLKEGGRHARLYENICDEKYGINGYYVMDPTNDKNYGKGFGEKKFWYFLLTTSKAQKDVEFSEYDILAYKNVEDFKRNEMIGNALSPFYSQDFFEKMDKEFAETFRSLDFKKDDDIRIFLDYLNGKIDREIPNEAIKNAKAVVASKLFGKSKYPVESLIRHINVEEEYELAEEGIKDFIEQQGYDEGASDNQIQVLLNRSKIICDIIYKSALEDYRNGIVDELTNLPKGDVIDKATDMIGLIAKTLKSKLKEADNPNELLEKITELGFTVDKSMGIDIDEKWEQLIEKAEKQAKQEQQAEEKKGDEATADTGDLDNLKQSYSESGIEPANLQNARNQMENTISQDKGQNQSTKEGEENDEH